MNEPSDPCWLVPPPAGRAISWRDLDHHGYDPEWGRVSRYRVFCSYRAAAAPHERSHRVIATGRTWEEANILADALNDRVRRVAGFRYTSWRCRMYLVELESPASYPEFCAARRARAGNG